MFIDGIKLKEMADVMSAVSHYSGILVNNLLQPSTGDVIQDGKCKEFFAKLLNEKGHMDSETIRCFNTIDVHVVAQMWSNTSGGWGGFGGAAMSTYYTTIIENKTEGFLAVYYNGQLAYVVEIDDVLKDLITKGYQYLPGKNSVGKLSILFNPKRR